MKSWKTVLSTLILLPIIVWSFQNCAPDHFAAHGNGTPYEGISVDQPNQDIPIEDETPIPPSDIDHAPGNKPPPAIKTVHSICYFDDSANFKRLIFGEATNGEDLVVLQLLNGDSLVRTIAEGRQQVTVNERTDSGVLIEMILYGTDSASVSYSINGSASQSELASCQNQ